MTRPSLLPTLLTPPEVMASLRISKRTFYRWIQTRKLVARRVHGRLRVPLEELHRVMGLDPLPPA